MNNPPSVEKLIRAHSKARVLDSGQSPFHLLLRLLTRDDAINSMVRRYAK